MYNKRYKTYSVNIYKTNSTEAKNKYVHIFILNIYHSHYIKKTNNQTKDQQMLCGTFCQISKF